MKIWKYLDYLVEKHATSVNIVNFVSWGLFVLGIASMAILALEFWTNTVLIYTSSDYRVGAFVIPIGGILFGFGGSYSMHRTATRFERKSALK